MSYIVVYQRTDGSSGVEECADLDLAVVSAERLRNVDSVERPRIFKTEEITYDFKPYYRVEVTTTGSGTDKASSDDEWSPAPAASGASASTSTFSSEAASTAPAAEITPAPPAPPSVTADNSATSNDSTSSDDSASSDDNAASDDGGSDDNAEPASIKKRLFDGDNAGDTAEFPSVTPEDPTDIVPPRRGLFGR